MSDYGSQLPQQPAPAHPGPPLGWRPMSGLAITSFILSLLLAVAAMMGWWISELIPICLGVLTLTSVKVTERRGRVLAIWAIVIAFAAGSCSYVLHSQGRKMFVSIGESMLTALDTEGSDESRDDALRPWAWAKGLEKDPELLKKWRDRFAAVEEEFGEWQAEFDLPTILKGMGPLFFAPDYVEEIGTGEEPSDTWVAGAVIWLDAVFEKGIVHVAIVLHSGSASARSAAESFREPGEASPVVGDLRFFKPDMKAP